VQQIARSHDQIVVVQHVAAGQRSRWSFAHGFDQGQGGMRQFGGAGGAAAFGTVQNCACNWVRAASRSGRASASALLASSLRLPLGSEKETIQGGEAGGKLAVEKHRPNGRSPACRFCRQRPARRGFRVSQGDVARQAAQKSSAMPDDVSPSVTPWAREP
jgi:hypothetical protein